MSIYDNEQERDYQNAVFFDEYETDPVNQAKAVLLKSVSELLPQTLQAIHLQLKTLRRTALDLLQTADPTATSDPEIDFLDDLIKKIGIKHDQVDASL